MRNINPTSEMSMTSNGNMHSTKEGGVSALHLWLVVAKENAGHVCLSALQCIANAQHT